MAGDALLGGMMAAAGVANLVLAATLAAFAISNRGVRSLALVLFVHGLWTSTYGAGLVVPDPSIARLLWSVYVYPLLTFGIVSLYFALVFPRPRLSPRLDRWVWLPATALAVTPLIAYGLRHDLVWSLDVPITHTLGPFFDPRVAGSAGPLMQAGIPVQDLFLLVGTTLVVRDFIRMEAGPLRRLVGIAAFGVFLPVLCGCLVAALYRLMTGARGYLAGSWVQVASDVIMTLEVVALVALSALLARAAFRPRDRDVKFFLLSYVAVIVVVTGLILLALAGRLGIPFPTLLMLLFSLGFLAGGGLLAYAIARRQVFDVDIRIKWTLRQGTVAAAFLACFFVITEIAAEILSRRWGLVAGILSAGALVFVLSPLQRMADRLANAAMPRVRSLSSLSQDERMDLFRQQVLFAWSDGDLSSDERRMLDFTRKRLGIPQEVAVKIEAEIADA